jgi:hypothetical protein
MKRYFGARKDLYKVTDYLHVPVIRPPALPPRVDMSDLYAPVMYQDSVNGCQGFAWDQNLCMWAKKLGVYNQPFSAMWIWNGARFEEGTLNQNVGVYTRDVLDWLLKKGSLLDDRWPFVGFQAISPPSSLEPEAAKYKIKAYFRVTDGYEGICSALAMGYPVSIGIPWHPKWYSCPRNGRLPDLKVADGAPEEFHEVTLGLYDLTEGVDGGINSWGPGWGKNGTFSFSMAMFDVFKYWGGYDASYVLIVDAGWPIEPVPAPIPVNKGCKLGQAFLQLANKTSLPRALPGQTRAPRRPLWR